MSSSDPMTGIPDHDLVRVLACHYGDGAVYVPRRPGQRHEILRRAMAAGLVTVDGFLTRRGRQLLARFGF